MSKINSQKLGQDKTEKSSETIKRKLEKTDFLGPSDAKQPEVTKHEAKKQKKLEPVKKQEEKLEKSSSNSGQSEASTSSGRTYEDDFKKHGELHLSYKSVYQPFGMPCTAKPKEEPESEEYGAFEFSLQNIRIKFRVAKTTPTKVGQFVTLWKRIGKGPIMPYDVQDQIDLFVICVREDKKFGQFVFPKSILASEKILSKSGKGGKRAIRIYAPWVKTESPQASNTKLWQCKYFINLSAGEKVDPDRIRKLYGFK